MRRVQALVLAQDAGYSLSAAEGDLFVVAEAVLGPSTCGNDRLFSRPSGSGRLSLIYLAPRRISLIAFASNRILWLL